MHVVFILVISAKRQCDDRNLGRQIVKPDADDLIRVESQGPDVEVFLVSLAADQLSQALQQLVSRRAKVHAQQTCGLQEATEMIAGSENKELLFVLIPVSANPAEHGGPIVQCVRQHT